MATLGSSSAEAKNKGLRSLRALSYIQWVTGESHSIFLTLLTSVIKWKQYKPSKSLFIQPKIITVQAQLGDTAGLVPDTAIKQVKGASGFPVYIKLICILYFVY